MARANLNKIEWLGDKCYRSIKVHTLEAQNLHQLKSPFHTKIYLNILKQDLLHRKQFLENL